MINTEELLSKIRFLEQHSFEDPQLLETLASLIEKKEYLNKISEILTQIMNRTTCPCVECQNRPAYSK